MSAESSFAEAVATFTHGGRYDLYSSVVRKGLNTGRSESEIIDYILANAPPPRPDPAKIRAAIRFCTANPLPAPPNGTRRPSCGIIHHISEAERREARRRRLDASARRFVESLRDRGHGTMTATVFAEGIRQTEAQSLALGNRPEAQAAAQLLALGGKVWAGTLAKDERGIMRKTPFVGNGIVDSADLADLIVRGDVRIPTHVSINPMSGNAGKTTKGNDSFDCLSCISSFRHALLEFDGLKDADGLPSQEQIDICAGLVEWADETNALRIVSATYSGGKSIHVILRIPDGDRESYRRQCAALVSLFASADDPAYRIDTSGWSTGANAATHVRLAGAVRPETGRRARLLWCL